MLRGRARLLLVLLQSGLARAFHDRPDLADASYWREHYAKSAGKLLPPSPFAQRVLSRLQPKAHQRILEIGCGSGRDARFFASHQLDVTALDLSAKNAPFDGVTFVNGAHLPWH